jgi:hypothetical protein
MANPPRALFVHPRAPQLRTSYHARTHGARGGAASCAAVGRPPALTCMPRSPPSSPRISSPGSARSAPRAAMLSSCTAHGLSDPESCFFSAAAVRAQRASQAAHALTCVAQGPRPAPAAAAAPPAPDPARSAGAARRQGKRQGRRCSDGAKPGPSKGSTSMQRHAAIAAAMP